MKIEIITLLIKVIWSTPVIRRRESHSIQLYSKTGYHMLIQDNGKVVSSRSHLSPLSVLSIDTDNRANFRISSVLNGLYLTIAPGRRHLIKATADPSEAVWFREIIQTNMYNTYALYHRPDCQLFLTSGGSYRIKCARLNIRRRSSGQRQTSKRSSFLPRRTHLKLNHFGAVSY